MTIPPEQLPCIIYIVLTLAIAVICNRYGGAFKENLNKEQDDE